MTTVVWIVAVFAGAAGAALGSGACVALEHGWRAFLTQRRRSRCVCGRALRATENVPVVGWLRAGGVAGCCGAPIPVWYLRAEVAGLVTGAGFGAGAAAAACGGTPGWVVVVAALAGVGACVGAASWVGRSGRA